MKDIYSFENALGELTVDLVKKRKSIPMILGIYDDITFQMSKQFKVFNSPESLEEFLIKDYAKTPNDVKDVHELAEHEREHINVGKEYDISSKLIYVPIIPKILFKVLTWYYDLPEKARDWSHDKMIDFITRALDITDPSSFDKKLLELINKNKIGD